MFPTHECGGDAAAYVLGALDTHELTAFRRHLDTCSVCEADVESLQQLTNVLPMSAPQYPASKHLRRSLMAEVRTDARAGLQTTSAPAWKPFANARPAWTSNLVPRNRPGLVGGFAVVLLVLVVIIAGVSASDSSKPKGAARAFQASVGSGTFYAKAGQDQLVVHKLASLPQSSTYEVWLVRGKGLPQPTSVLFNTSASGDDAVKVPGNLHGVTEILVTREPAPHGSATPSGAPVLEADIS